MADPRARCPSGQPFDADRPGAGSGSAVVCGIVVGGEMAVEPGSWGPLVLAFLAGPLAVAMAYVVTVVIAITRLYPVGHRSAQIAILMAAPFLLGLGGLVLYS